MKVCHITSCHPRYDGRIFQKECVSLTKKYNVYLLVNDDKKDEIKDKVNFVSTKFQPKNRFERFFKSKKNIIKKALEIDADIYHLHDPDLLGIVKKLKQNKKLVVFDSHEDYPALIKEKEWIPRAFRNLISKLYEIREKKILKITDAVIGVSPHIGDRLKLINTNSYMVTNYPILSNLKIKKEDDGKTICFAGGISNQWLHGNIIKAIEDIKNIKYLLIGNNKSDYFETLKKLDGFNKVEAVGLVSKQDVIKYYGKSTIAIALNDYVSNVNYKMGTLGNTKLFEYMEAGLPVVCTDFVLWKEIVEKNNCGVCVNPNNINEIKDAIEYLIANPKIVKEMGKNGKNLVREYYNWGTQEKILFEAYNKILKEYERK